MDAQLKPAFIGTKAQLVPAYSTAATGWTHKIYGITPSKVYGIEPTKVNGI